MPDLGIETTGKLELLQLGFERNEKTNQYRIVYRLKADGASTEGA